MSVTTICLPTYAKDLTDRVAMALRSMKLGSHWRGFKPTQESAWEEWKLQLRARRSKYSSSATVAEGLAARIKHEVQRAVENLSKDQRQDFHRVSNSSPFEGLDDGALRRDCELSLRNLVEEMALSEPRAAMLPKDDGDSVREEVQEIIRAFARCTDLTDTDLNGLFRAQAILERYPRTLIGSLVTLTAEHYDDETDDPLTLCSVSLGDEGISFKCDGRVRDWGSGRITIQRWLPPAAISEVPQAGDEWHALFDFVRRSQKSVWIVRDNSDVRQMLDS